MFSQKSLYKKHYSKLLLLCVSFLFIYYQSLPNISKGLFPSKLNPRLYEIGAISFEGNSSFSSSELRSVIASRYTERSWQHQIFEYLSEQVNRNPAAPNELKKNLNKTLQYYQNEIRYFDESRTYADTLSLWHFYNTRGFHEVSISYIFYPDSSSQKNILKFIIKENNRYKLAVINYQGFDSIPVSIAEGINSLRTVKIGSYFSENAVVDEFGRILRFLLDNGYYYARYEDPPRVIKDTTLKTDSIIVYFRPDIRQRIESISFIDSTRGQNGVSQNTKNQQLEFEKGDWYSRSNIVRSEDNLRFLGTFDIVKIDTSSVFRPITDTSLAMTVFTQYRKLQEWNLGWFINQSTFGNFINTGIEGTYINRNLLGKAQVFNPFARFMIKDISTWLENPFKNQIELEGQIGLSFGQPLLWIWDNSRIGLFWNPIYSYRIVSGDLPISTFSVPFKFQVKFPGITYFNNMSLDFLLEWQSPLNYEEARDNALSSVQTHSDSLKVIESIILLDALYRYNQANPVYYPTANIVGLSIFADHRDNFFSPTRGDYAAISLDAGMPIGIARFLRLQFAYYRFHSFNRYTVLALKSRIGGIYQWDTENSYIPFERLFFCGGANSVRGWQARKLRYTNMPEDTISSNLFLEFIENFLGSTGLFEGSAEIRYRFQRTGTLGDFWDEQIANMGITVFLDIGNAFNWVADTYTETNFSDYFTKLALAAGVGFRYETPVGPFRVDFGWPIFDPSMTQKNWLWERDNPLGKFAFHVALGHAF